ncbi:helix-turn-helix domain-containing protein [Microbispora sp. GKU 823]|uniref:winged helix-turn-helix transcriptional regulator n=1 Tax=Microbispora sp. GKU 823 TaxID=1652100 RepID=UPI001C4DE99B|nr:helix-turn-helix domain-containing protein [Microbispora sp. GKU 823]
METRRIDPVNCSVARALSVVGERWSLLIVREALDGARRFGEFHSRLGIARNLLATRLETLVTAGVMRRVPYQDPGDRQRFAYELTEQGRALRPTLVALLEWGDTYLADPQGPSVIVRHGPSTMRAPATSRSRSSSSALRGTATSPRKTSAARPGRARASWKAPEIPGSY